MGKTHNCTMNGCAGQCQCDGYAVTISHEPAMDETSFLLATAIVEHSADLYELVRAHVKILQRCREARILSRLPARRCRSNVANVTR